MYDDCNTFFKRFDISDMLFLFQENHVKEEKEEQPTAMNAFELISMSKGLNLGNLFDTEQVIVLILYFSRALMVPMMTDTC